jgi:hypothetical protein
LGELILKSCARGKRIQGRYWNLYYGWGFCRYRIAFKFLPNPPKREGPKMGERPSPARRLSCGELARRRLSPFRLSSFFRFRAFPSSFPSALFFAFQYNCLKILIFLPSRQKPRAFVFAFIKQACYFFRILCLAPPPFSRAKGT